MCFNPHARVGRDLKFEYYISAEFGFNPHARVGRD